MDSEQGFTIFIMICLGVIIVICSCVGLHAIANPNVRVVTINQPRFIIDTYNNKREFKVYSAIRRVDVK